LGDAETVSEPGAFRSTHLVCHDNVYAFQNQQAEASQTYVALVGDDVVGFYTAITLGD